MMTLAATTTPTVTTTMKGASVLGPRQCTIFAYNDDDDDDEDDSGAGNDDDHDDDDKSRYGAGRVQVSCRYGVGTVTLTTTTTTTTTTPLAHNAAIPIREAHGHRKSLCESCPQLARQLDEWNQLPGVWRRFSAVF